MDIREEQRREERDQACLETIKASYKENHSPAQATRKREYREGVYYGKIYLFIVIFVGVMTTYSTIDYLRMGSETYYTTGYRGDIRTLHPSHIERR